MDAERERLLRARSQSETWLMRQIHDLWGCKSRPGRLHAVDGMMLGDARIPPSLLSIVGSAIRDREALVAENLLLRHELAVLTRPTRKRPRLRARDKLFWVVARALHGDWRRHLFLVRPESVIPWHRQAWRLFGAGAHTGRWAADA
jgi:hypothetical protein